jgi:hypothetical protein
LRVSFECPFCCGFVCVCGSCAQCCQCLWIALSVVVLFVVKVLSAIEVGVNLHTDKKNPLPFKLCSMRLSFYILLIYFRLVFNL